MVATADSSFVETREFTHAHGKVFFWTMLALAALDIILLFWILTPLPKPAKTADTQTFRTTLGDSTAKRSPLGTVALRVTSKPARTRTNFTTVAYSGR